ncbi:MAG: acetolactate synthase large subunit [Actinomycetaceae bacterium]|nr:acetolactate synthase large subunit [Actinomycetaceae bacterium]
MTTQSSKTQSSAVHATPATVISQAQGSRTVQADATVGDPAGRPKDVPPGRTSSAKSATKRMSVNDATPSTATPAVHAKPAHSKDVYQRIMNSRSEHNGKKTTGATAIVWTLEALGITEMFGLPGGSILPTYDALYDCKIRHILARHEQGAGHAAEGYALASGKPGVAMVTSGPGATNLLTALADAHLDSIPLLAVSGQVGADAIGTDAFQESDAVGASMPLTKHNFLVKEAEDIVRTITEGYYICQTGRPGPVLVDITKSAQNAEVVFQWPPKMDLPGYRPASKPHPKQLRQAAEMIASAQRPMLYVGGGVIKSNASPELKALAQTSGAPVVTTLTARGAFPDSHELHYGMPGMHGDVAAVASLQRCDVLVALGARFDDRVTGTLDTFAPDATVIHVDIDAAEISKNRTADVPIVGDVGLAMEGLEERIRDIQEKQGKQNLQGWYNYLNRLRDKYPLYWDEPEDGLMAPQYVIERLGKIAGSDAIYCAGVGQHQMWASQFISYEKPRTYISSCGLGTMGVAIPEAMGAKVAFPDRTVWAIDGDGCFQMTNQELAICTLENIPIKVALINNSSLGMVRQWQNLFYGCRFSNTDLHDGEGTVEIPDFVKLAEAYGAVGMKVTKKDDVDEAIRKAMEINDRPVVIDFRVSPNSMVFPMIPAGKSCDDIIYAPDQPVWDKG